MKSSPKLRRIRTSNVAKAREKWLSLTPEQRKTAKLEKKVAALQKNTLHQIKTQDENAEMAEAVKDWAKRHPELRNL